MQFEGAASAGLVTHTGFEPVISTVRGWRPGPLDEWAMAEGNAS